MRTQRADSGVGAGGRAKGHRQGTGSPRAPEHRGAPASTPRTSTPSRRGAAGGARCDGSWGAPSRPKLTPEAGQHWAAFPPARPDPRLDSPRRVTGRWTEINAPVCAALLKEAEPRRREGSCQVPLGYQCPPRRAAAGGRTRLRRCSHSRVKVAPDGKPPGQAGRRVRRCAGLVSPVLPTPLCAPSRLSVPQRAPYPQRHANCVQGDTSLPLPAPRRAEHASPSTPRRGRHGCAACARVAVAWRPPL